MVYSFRSVYSTLVDEYMRNLNSIFLVTPVHLHRGAHSFSSGIRFCCTPVYIRLNKGDMPVVKWLKKGLNLKRTSVSGVTLPLSECANQQQLELTDRTHR